MLRPQRGLVDALEDEVRLVPLFGLALDWSMAPMRRHNLTLNRDVQGAVEGCRPCVQSRSSGLTVESLSRRQTHVRTVRSTLPLGRRAPLIVFDTPGILGRLAYARLGRSEGLPENHLRHFRAPPMWGLSRARMATDPDLVDPVSPDWCLFPRISSDG